MWDNKGIAIMTIVEIALATLAFLFILGLWNKASAETNEVFAEQLCHKTNLLRVGTSVSVIGEKNVRLTPRGCKTIDTKVPDEEHIRNAFEPNVRDPEAQKEKYAAMQHIADLAARCWWMWLEGAVFQKSDSAVRNVFDDAVFSGKKCFICYTFEIDKPVQFTAGELYDYMNTAFYKIKDTSDKCSVGGGVCKQKCDQPDSRDQDNKFKVKSSSGSCSTIRPGAECCVVDTASECENRGGLCGGDSTRFVHPFNGWTCKNPDKPSLCYIAKENYFPYTKYIQEFNGRGRFHVQAANGFTQQQTYVVAFDEDITGWLVPSWLSTEETQVDGIIIAPLKDIGQNCQVEAGTPGE